MSVFRPGLETISFSNKAHQNGLEGSLYGDKPFLKTQWSQGAPPKGLGYIAATNNLFSATVGDGPQTGWERDGWKPLWADKRLQQKTRGQMYDWNTATASSAVGDVFMHNQGVIFNNKGAPYTLPTQADIPPAMHKLRTRTL